MGIREEQQKEMKKVSFVYIPHSGIKVFRISLHVNIIRFFFVILFFLIVATILVFNKESFFFKEKSFLEKKHKLINLIFLSFNKEKKHFRDLTTEYLKITKKHRDILIDKNKIKSFLSNRKNLLGSSEVYTLKSQLELRESLLILKYIVEVQGIAKYIPFGWPVKSGFITSSYGSRRSPFDLQVKNFHYGYDFANIIGTSLFSTGDGVVSDVFFHQSGYGTHLKIEHAFGFISLYAHTNKLFVSIGEKIQKGQKIATLGMTGSVTGPHVHYEIRLLKDTIYNPLTVPLNPLPYISEGF